MKKNQKGISLIFIIILIVIVLFAIYIIYTKAEDSEWVYENEEVLNEENEAKRYYYNQLLEPEKIMYDTILSNIESLKNGNVPIKFPEEVSKSIKNTGGDENKNYFQSTWDALSLDNIDLFYIDTKNISLSTKKLSILGYKSYEYTLEPQGGKKYYNSTFNNRLEVDNALEQVNEIVDNVISGAQGSTYNKVKYIHDWIVDNFDYDTDDKDNNDNIYGAFIEKSVVCEGYAEAFKYMLDKLNIPSVLVYGNGIDNNGNSEAHAWNYVKMTDGKWYAVDTTWDDPIYIGASKWFKNNSQKYANFLKGSDEFNKSHISDGDVSETGQNFKYPELSKEDYKRNSQ